MKTPETLPHPDFAGVAVPGVMISNAWPQSRLENGATLEATRRVREQHPFFEAFQTVDIPFAEERRAFRKLIGDQGHPHTYTLTRVFVLILLQKLRSKLSPVLALCPVGYRLLDVGLSRRFL